MPSSFAANLLSGLPPNVNQDTHTLILGSFPGKASLDAQQYYGHPRNQFWRLMSALFQENFIELPYSQRLEHLLAHGIGLWDIIATCERKGSLDSAIRHPTLNEFGNFIKEYSSIKLICFNGQKAGQYAHNFIQMGFSTLLLPSSSPANARLSFEKKLMIWREILQHHRPVRYDH